MKQPKRRFLGLRVDEVSLVDSPANEVEFLVTKALEDDMAGKGEIATVEHEAGEGESVAKALEHVENIVKTVMRGGDAPESEEGTAAAIEKARKTFTPAAMLKSIGLKKEDYDTAMSKLQKDFGLDANEKFQNMQPPLSKTAKAAKKPAPAVDDAEDEADGGDDEEAEGEKPNPKAKAKKSEPALADPVDMLMSAIQKMHGDIVVEKAKHLTKARVEKLKTMMETLKVMIAEVEEGTQPKGTVEAGNGSTLNTSGIKDLESPMEQPVFKAADIEATVAKAVKAAVTPLLEEIEAIKKAKPVSNSLEGGETETKKAKPSLWGGLL